MLFALEGFTNCTAVTSSVLESIASSAASCATALRMLHCCQAFKTVRYTDTVFVNI